MASISERGAPVGTSNGFPWPGNLGGGGSGVRVGGGSVGDVAVRRRMVGDRDGLSG